MFVSNKRTSSYLWCKENLVKHQRVPKYYKNDCLQNFLLSYMPLLAAKFVKNSCIYSRTYFIFLKNVKLETLLFILSIYFLFIPPYKINTIKTLLFKLFDKLIW